MLTVQSFDELIQAAKDERWEAVDAAVGGYTDARCVVWALTEGMTDDDNRNVRDLGATILDESDEPLAEQVVTLVHHRMMVDPYVIVRLRLAIALWKRGHQDDQTRQKMSEALQHPDLGKLAARYFES